MNAQQHVIITEGIQTIMSLLDARASELGVKDLERRLAAVCQLYAEAQETPLLVAERTAKASGPYLNEID